MSSLRAPPRSVGTVANADRCPGSHYKEIPMPTVRIEPSGLEIEVAHGESVAEAAWRQGYHWPTQCWGQAECMVCFVRVLSGEDEIEPPEAEEAHQLETVLPRPLRGPHTRLACRLQIRSSGVVLEKKGVRAPEQPVPDGKR